MIPVQLPPRTADLGVVRAVRTGLTLTEVVREIPEATLVDGSSSEVRIHGVHHDSRSVEPGDLFVARAGARSDGAGFIVEAAKRGATAVLVERGKVVDTHGLPRIEASNVARALAFAAAAIYGHPTFALEAVGITGTNGKTTTAHLVQAAIDASGGRAGIVGTLGYRFEDLDLTATHTSPEADDLTRVAAAMLARGATHLVMEVSSIALAAHRADAVHFRVAAFTNLTQDHLDYHGTMEAYAAAKMRLFLDLAPAGGAINVDDPFGRRLADTVASRLGPRVLRRFSAKVGASSDVAEIAPLSVTQSRSGIAMDVRTPAGIASIRSPLYGAHNVENILTAVSVASLLHLDLGRVAESLSRSVTVPGRLERCDDPGIDDIAVLVDYAHTPDALARVLYSVRKMGGEGRLLCVFGCGGDRDPTKRPLMGEAVGQSADVAIVTNDNPRSEDPRAIADAILVGLTGLSGVAGRAVEVIVELDRRRAIERAILEAKPGDSVVLAGKGHEPYQIIGAVTTAFDDRDEARRALRLRRRAAGTSEERAS